jgi:ABC-type Fe3+/spermidine/putrescine transport system ATPase subunit
MALLEVREVSKAYGDTPVLHHVSMDAADGEIVCLLGPSGCGKTTLLRIIAGLETTDTGTVTFNGQDMAGVPVYRRGFGYMFQEYVLFPHRNVYENVAFGLRMAGAPRASIDRRVAEMLDLVDLQGYEQRRIYELSGGQQQRVALARSLAPSPRLLLLDEPLGSLDRTLREDLLIELRRILKQVGVTAVYVTHDQQEAFAIADRVLIMNAGRIEQEGPPQAVYRRPANRFVARFLGMHNLLPGRLLAEPPVPEVATPVGTLACSGCREGLAVGDAVTVLVRPDAAALAPLEGDERIPNMIAGVLLGQSFRGSQVRVEMGYGMDGRLVFELPGGAADDLPATGQPVRLQIDPDGLTLLSDGEGVGEHLFA